MRHYIVDMIFRNYQAKTQDSWDPNQREHLDYLVKIALGL